MLDGRHNTGTDRGRAASGTSAATVGGLIFAVFKAGREVERARTDRQAEIAQVRADKQAAKRAEVGGEVLVATLRLLSALDWVSGLTSKVRAEKSTTSESVADVAEREPVAEREDRFAMMRRETQRRWESIADVGTEFVRAWELAETYLPDSVHALLVRVWDLRAAITAAQMTFFAVSFGAGTEMFAEGWGSDPESKIKAIRVEARALLRPIAQLEQAASQNEPGLPSMR